MAQASKNKATTKKKRSVRAATPKSRYGVRRDLAPTAKLLGGLSLVLVGIIGAIILS